MTNVMRAAVLCGLVLSACAQPEAAPPAPGPAAFCRTHVDGRSVLGEHGEVVVLHGFNLPPLSVIEASGRVPADLLTEAAQAGAGVVRLAVVDAEVTAPYVPEKLVPFIERANALGLLVIVSRHNDPADTINNQADNTDDFVRALVTALRGVNGVWLEPFEQPLATPPGRQRAVVARLIDVVRGLGDERVIVVRNAQAWLNSGESAINTPFSQGNVVYGVGRPDEVDAGRLPVMLLGDTAQPGNLAGLGGAMIGSAALALDQRAMLPESTRCLGK